MRQQFHVINKLGPCFLTGDNTYQLLQISSLQENIWTTRTTSNISRTLVGNKIVYNSDVVGASPVGAAPTTSSFST